jgi:hypothetical protein
LFGTALALGCARAILLPMLWTLPGCVLLGLIGLMARNAIDGCFMRLLVGGVALGLVCLSTLATLMPGEAMAALRALPGPLRRARRRDDVDVDVVT